MKAVIHNKKKFEKPTSWLQLKNGRWISGSIQARLDEWYHKLFGEHMLKLGGLSCELLSHHCNIQHQVNLDIHNPLCNVIANQKNLPFLEKTFNAIIMSHQLDYCNNPHLVLREVDRVMIDDGYLILTGFNPISFAGLAGWIPWRKKNLLQNKYMFTPYRLKEWLTLLNYQVIHCDLYALFPMQYYQNIWTWFENNLGDWSTPIRSLYFIVARKRTYPIKPIKSHWELKRSLFPMNASYRLNKGKNWSSFVN
ncbi:hypothetical protein CF67_02008 [Candidatus Photodesmus blepharus]|uniref:Methyltransferase type 11 domain-containing protein n=1 Tax=Candidatus Photodesmus blepharonis TaxID=1179155 RepID=A0A084CNI0_9GAMM|nr:methyltransferase domain-containing protein [Candidatus Photodesmus blepharus]KEY91359.1 hypothetical protein CF67_02008 [Candidatus Photodesmus blepharus]